MKNSIKKAALGLAIILSVSSCETLQDLCEISEEDVATGELFVSSLTQVLDVYERVDMVRKDSVLMATGSNVIDGANCTLTNDSMIIDFGETPVFTLDGKSHTGSIRSKVSGDYAHISGSIDATLVGYIVNEKIITGDLSVVNQATSGQPLYSLTTTDFEVNNDTKVNYSLDLQWLSGFETVALEDDILDVSGQVSGIDSLSTKEFTADILSPLHLNGACAYVIERGEIKISLVDDELVPTIDIDFINSDSCNNLFNATVDCTGNPLSFTFPFEN